MTLTDLLVYPLKSTRALRLEVGQVERTGLRHDRAFAVIDESNRVLTAREHKALFAITTRITEDTLVLSDDSGEVALGIADGDADACEVQLFSNPVHANLAHPGANAWLSERLGLEVRLIRTDTHRPRAVKDKYAGGTGATISFQDAAPVHLVNEASVAHLNATLAEPVTALNFRPNLIVDAGKPYAEDAWRTVTIGDCVFDVTARTGRCSMTGLDPATLEAYANQDPLRTLALSRRANRSVLFGVYLVPRGAGVIRREDEVRVAE